MISVYHLAVVAGDERRAFVGTVAGVAGEGHRGIGRDADRPLLVQMAAEAVSPRREDDGLFAEEVVTGEAVQRAVARAPGRPMVAPQA